MLSIEDLIILHVSIYFVPTHQQRRVCYNSASENKSAEQSCLNIEEIKIPHRPEGKAH